MVLVVGAVLWAARGLPGDRRRSCFLGQRTCPMCYSRKTAVTILGDPPHATAMHCFTCKRNLDHKYWD